MANAIHLTELVTARIDKKLKQRLDFEVRQRRRRGECVHGADITREALISYLTDSPKAADDLEAKAA